MLHIGLDIHSTRISVRVLNGTVQVVHRAQVRGLAEILAVLKGLPDRFEVCYEASCGYGHSHNVPKPLAAWVLVAYPGQLRLSRSAGPKPRDPADDPGTTRAREAPPTPPRDRERDPGGTPRSDTARRDAAGVNGVTARCRMAHPGSG